MHALAAMWLVHNPELLVECKAFLLKQDAKHTSTVGWHGVVHVALCYSAANRMQVSTFTSPLRAGGIPVV